MHQSADVQVNKNTMTPHVTVLMSVYNSARYLAEAIDSILNQTFSDFEFIIVNDGSTDVSREIIQSYSDKRIRLIDNVINLGLPASLNKGMALSRGTYIARMDADDVALPNRLSSQIDFMGYAQNVDICGSWYEFFGDWEKVVKPPVDHQDIKGTLFFKNCIAHSTVCIRKSSFEKSGLSYDEAYRYAQDYELWCRLVNSLVFANMPKILLKYRVHILQARERHGKKQDEFADRVRRKNLQAIGLQLPREEEKIYFDMVAGRFMPKNKADVLRGAIVLEKIYCAGDSVYGRAFQQMIRKFMKPLPEKSIRLHAASLSLFFNIFLKRNIFSTKREKLRYFCHAFKNFVGI